MGWGGVAVTRRKSCVFGGWKSSDFVAGWFEDGRDISSFGLLYV